MLARANWIDHCDHRDRRGQAAVAAAALAIVLAIAAAWMLTGAGGEAEGLAGVQVQYFDATVQPALRVTDTPVTPSGAVARTTTAVVRPSAPSGSHGSAEAVELAAGLLDQGDEGSVGLEGGGPRSKPLVPGLAGLLTAPEVEAVELGHAEGDFVYRRDVGWCRYEQATTGTPGRFVPIDAGRLPSDLGRRYPAGRFPPDGHRVTEPGCSAVSSVSPETGPWELHPPE